MPSFFTIAMAIKWPEKDICINHTTGASQIISKNPNLKTRENFVRIKKSMKLDDFISRVFGPGIFFLSFVDSGNLPIPMAASPAPWKRNVWSDNFVLVALNEAKSPATATEAVP